MEPTIVIIRLSRITGGMKTVLITGMTICVCGIRKKCGKLMNPSLMRPLGRGGAILMPDWQDYGPETGLEEYLNTAESFSIALDVKGDFTKSEEAIEVLRKRMLERNWGLDLYVSYFDQEGREIGHSINDINEFSAERIRPKWTYKNMEMKERWEHAGANNE